MKFSDWLVENNENGVIYEDDAVLIRDARPGEIPSHFVHRSDDQSAIDDIAQNGYNLNRFNQTARKYNIPQDMIQYAPRGAYSLSVDDPMVVSQKNDPRPFIVFKAAIDKALILILKDKWADPKEPLSKINGGKTGAQLRNALLKQGYQAVLIPGSEQIILDTKLMKPVRTS